MPTEHATQRAKNAQQELRIPVHIGVTMDGNGRWARLRGQPRTAGHREGINALKRLVKYCISYGVPYLTVFSFSSENWQRPKEEIEFIFNLLHRFVESDLKELVGNNVCVRIIGDRKTLSNKLQETISRVENNTQANTGLCLNVAFNYGGKAEIVEAAKHLAKKVADGTIDADDIDEQAMAGALYTAGMPEPDLMIRTGGEQRFSNFLIWQAAYAELVFLKEYWPDFEEETFVKALELFSERQRRFGALEEEQTS